MMKHAIDLMRNAIGAMKRAKGVVRRACGVMRCASSEMRRGKEHDEACNRGHEGKFNAMGRAINMMRMKRVIRVIGVMTRPLRSASCRVQLV